MEKEENETVIVKRSVSILFRLRLLIFFCQVEDSESCGNSWLSLGMNLVFCLSVILWPCRVCLLLLMCLCLQRDRVCNGRKIRP